MWSVRPWLLLAVWSGEKALGGWSLEVVHLLTLTQEHLGYPLGRKYGKMVDVVESSRADMGIAWGLLDRSLSAGRVQCAGGVVRMRSARARAGDVTVSAA